MLELRAVRNDRDEPILYDMFVYGEWIGSRRLPEQCILHWQATLPLAGSDKGARGLAEQADKSA